MPLKVGATVRANTLLIKLEGIKKDVSDAVQKGLKKGGSELSRYIKYELLEGKLVKKRTGELQRGIYVRVIDKKKVVVTVRGPRSVVAEWIDKGISHTWIIRPRLAKRLVFVLDRGPNAGRKIRTTYVLHPGIKARHFMREGAKAKRERVISLVKDSVQEALRQKFGRKRV